MSKKPKSATAAKVQKHYEVVKAYGPWSVGHVFTAMQPNEAGTLITRGLIKEVATKAALQAPANRMMGSGDLLTR